MKSIGEVVATTLSNLGLPVPADIIQTVLLKDRHFVGYKYRYDGGYAIMLAGSSTIEFCTDDSKLLTSAAIEADKGVAA